MKRALLVALFAISFAVPALAAGTVGKVDRDGNVDPCSCACVNVMGKLFCLCVCN